MARIGRFQPRKGPIRFRINILTIIGIAIGLLSAMAPWLIYNDRFYTLVSNGWEFVPVPYIIDPGFVLAFVVFIIGTLLALLTPYSSIIQFFGAGSYFILMGAGNYSPHIGPLIALASACIVLASLFNPIWIGYDARISVKDRKERKFTFDPYRYVSKPFALDTARIALRNLFINMSIYTKKELAKPKSGFICQKCGNMIPIIGSTCPSCGATIGEWEKKILCPFCGRETYSTVKSCRWCAFDITKKSHCRSCYLWRPRGASICPHCGFDNFRNLSTNNDYSTAVRCTNCGLYSQFGALSCPYCGFERIKIGYEQVKYRFIVIDGIDGCGKDAHAQKMRQFLEKNGQQVTVMSHPSKRIIGRLAKRSLQGKGILARIYATTFFTLDVLTSVRWLKRNPFGTIIFVRYLIGTAYLPKSLAPIGYKFFRNFLPFPDLAIFVDVEPEIAIKRIQSRDHTLEMFEDVEKLRSVGKVAKSLISQEWVVIDNNQEGEAPFKKVEAILIANGFA